MGKSSIVCIRTCMQLRGTPHANSYESLQRYRKHCCRCSAEEMGVAMVSSTQSIILHVSLVNCERPLQALSLGVVLPSHLQKANGICLPEPFCYQALHINFSCLALRLPAAWNHCIKQNPIHESRKNNFSVLKKLKMH